MLHHIMYANKLRQEQIAKHYPIIVKSDKLENGFYDPAGEKYEYAKLGKSFRCSKVEKEDFKTFNLNENLKVTNSSLILYTTDFRIVNAKVSRGDKIIYQGNEYSIESYSKPSTPSGKQFQRKNLNGALLLNLT